LEQEVRIEIANILLLTVRVDTPCRALHPDLANPSKVLLILSRWDDVFVPPFSLTEVGQDITSWTQYP
jgi:hypothetical protein